MAPERSSATIIVLISFLVLTHSLCAHALVTSEFSLSGGYSHDIQDVSRFPVFLYWNLTHATASGVQTNLDVGANNNLLQNRWGFYLYEGFVSIPLTLGYDHAPYRKSRIQIGRQLLTEGFELALLDGFQMPVYWSENGGVRFIGGATTSLQEKEFDPSSQLYGGTLQQKFWGATWTIGGFHKRHSPSGGTTFGSPDLILQNVANAGATWSFEDVPFTPFIAAKSQWDLATRENTQAQGEFSLFPSNFLALGALYRKRVPSTTDPREIHFIYRLFAVSPQKTAGAYLTLSPSESASIQITGQQAQYDSQAQTETGTEFEAMVNWRIKSTTWTPSVTRIQSWGGTLWEPSLIFRKILNSRLSVRAQGAAAKIEKINGINAWAFHTRTGLEFNPAARLIALAQLEFGQNHLFEYDVRGIVFLSYFLF